VGLRSLEQLLQNCVQVAARLDVARAAPRLGLAPRFTRARHRQPAHDVTLALLLVEDLLEALVLQFSPQNTRVVRDVVLENGPLLLEVRAHERVFVRCPHQVRVVIHLLVLDELAHLH
jgi:hypothetical protein